MWYYVVFHPTQKRLLPLVGPLFSMESIEPYKRKAVREICKRDQWADFYDFYVVRSKAISTSPFNSLFVDSSDQMTVSDCLRARLLWSVE